MSEIQICNLNYIVTSDVIYVFKSSVEIFRPTQITIKKNHTPTHIQPKTGPLS